jgi:hypothetical protein
MRMLEGWSLGVRACDSYFDVPSDTQNIRTASLWKGDAPRSHRGSGSPLAFAADAAARVRGGPPAGGAAVARGYYKVPSRRGVWHRGPHAGPRRRDRPGQPAPAPLRASAADSGVRWRFDAPRRASWPYAVVCASDSSQADKRAKTFLRTRLVSRCPPGPAQPTLHEPLGPHPQRPAPCAPRPRRADRADLGLYVHLHCLVTDGAFEERGAEAHFPPAPAPTPERMTAVLAQVHKATAAVAQDDDLDSTLRWPPACSSGSPARIWRRPSRQQGLR